MGMALTLGDALDNVDEDDVGELFGGDPMGGSGAYVAGTYDAYFLTHEFSFREDRTWEN